MDAPLIRLGLRFIAAFPIPPSSPRTSPCPRGCDSRPVLNREIIASMGYPPDLPVYHLNRGPENVPFALSLPHTIPLSQHICGRTSSRKTSSCLLSFMSVERTRKGCQSCPLMTWHKSAHRRTRERAYLVRSCRIPPPSLLLCIVHAQPGQNSLLPFKQCKRMTMTAMASPRPCGSSPMRTSSI